MVATLHVAAIVTSWREAAQDCHCELADSNAGPLAPVVPLVGQRQDGRKAPRRTPDTEGDGQRQSSSFSPRKRAEGSFRRNVMRLSLPLGLVAVGLIAGCAADRCQQCGHCCHPPIPAGAGMSAPAPVEAVAPAETLEAPPEPPAAALRPDAEPATQPVSIVADDWAVYGRDPEFRWLLGRLERIEGYGGQWRLRYATLDTWDEHGTSVVLEPDVRLDEYRDGDFVYVRGEVASSSTSHLRGAVYRVRIIRPSTSGDRQRLADQYQ
jgi:hypothetical protein